MSAFPPTPLEPLGAGDFVKREDRLPYGGGSKVRRLVPWLRALPASSRVACLSDAGSHTFLVLARLLRSGEFPVERLIFLERRVPPSPYREWLRAEYADDARVVVRSGPTPTLLLRSLWSRTRWRTLGIGGTTGGDGEPHAEALRECAEQLRQAGVGSDEVTHVLASASGETALGFTRAIDAGVPGTHRLTLVATGPKALRGRLRRRFAGRADVTVVDPPPAAAPDPTPFPVDPVHVAHALAHVRERERRGPAVLWVTSPTPPSAA